MAAATEGPVAVLGGGACAVPARSVSARTGYTFVDVGLAFARIRDYRLYRIEFPTFEAYCQQKWQYGPTMLIACYLQPKCLRRCLQFVDIANQKANPIFGP